MQLHAHPPLTPACLLRAGRRHVVALGLFFVLLGLAAAVAGGKLLLTWDAPIQRSVESSRSSLLDDVFLTVSRLGGTLVVLVTGSVLTLVTWRRCRAVAVAVAVATVSRPLLEFLLKSTVDRSRPDYDRLVPGNGPSFPSGHVMAAVALWGLLPVVVGLYSNRHRVWWASVALAGGLVGMIAASRVYLGVHWFSDIVGGLVIGALFLIGVEMVLHRAHLHYPCLPPSKEP